MSRTLSRRAVLAMAGVAALGARASRAQNLSSPHGFANGNELVWTEPWMGFPIDSMLFPIPDAAMLMNPNGSQLVVGYFDEPTTVTDFVEEMFKAVYGDGPRPANIAGGSEQTSFEGATVSQEFGIYLGTEIGQQTAFFFLLTNGQQLEMIMTDPAKIGASTTTAQETVTLNGSPVFKDIDGAAIDEVIAAAAPVGTVEYADELDLLHVTYPENWHVISQDRVGIELANPAESFVYAIQIYEAKSSSKDDQIEWLRNFYLEDQGPDARISTLEISDEEVTWAVDGEYGLRLMQIIFTSNPERPIVVRASDFEGGRTEALAVLEEIQAAILVNDATSLQGLETHITELMPE